MRRSRHSRGSPTSTHRRQELYCLIAAALGAGALAGPAAAREVPFAEPPAISTNANAPFSVFAADVDGDGDADVLSASFNDDTIAWYENSGSGDSWSAHSISTSADEASSVFAADVDGDGDLDVLSASSGDDKIAWYENTAGDGSSWTLHTISASADDANSVFAADVDGDGDTDALSASFVDDKIAWYENTAGDGSSWTLHTISTSADVAHSVFAADVDGDGDLDVLSASAGDDKVAWYENDGSGGAWTLHTITTSADGANSVVAAEVDGDGDRDVLAASHNDDMIAWYENDGSGGTWSLHTIATTAESPRSVFSADVDGDGDLDALSASRFDDKIAWYENDGSGSGWTLHTITTGADSARFVFSADVDGDGDLDVLSASSGDNTIAWYRNDAIHRSAVFPVEFSIAALDDARDIAAGDLVGNGLTDAAAASFGEDTVAWYSNAVASWTPHTITSTADGANSVDLADLDADGDLDVISTAALDGAVAWHENDGSPFDGGWVSHTITTSAESARAAIAVDLDRDGDLDVVSASKVDNKLAWYESDGTPADGGWVTHTITTGASGTESVIAADLDGDGDSDLVSVNFFADELAWYENDGTPADGGWLTHTLATGIQDPRSVVAADVDGDGDMDAIAASQYSDAVIWYENDGTPADGAWAAHTISTTAATVQDVFAADMDADGDVDALSASSADSKVAWYENDGTGSIWTLHTVSVTAGAVRSVFVADVDGDGDLDPLSAPLSGAPMLWYPNEGGQFALPTLDVAQKVVGNSEVHDLLDIKLAHRGRLGDSDVEWTSVQLEFTDDTGAPIGLSDQTDLFESIRVYLDDGSGAFEPGFDTQVAIGAGFCCSSGIRTINFVDDDPDVAASFGLPRTYFVVAEMTADAESQSPSSFRVTHLTQSTSTADNADHDIPLILEFATNTDTSVVDTELTSTSCEAPFDLKLADRSVDFTLTCEAGTILSAETFSLTGSADVTFRSGEQVTLLPGFSVQSGQFAVEIDPALKP